MNERKFIEAFGFKPKENAQDIFERKFPQFGNYALEVDFGKKAINYGNKITCDAKTTQNFSQPENWVVLECVCRLLEKGYKPENICLEKVWPSGHGTSGRLDILVSRENGKSYLMIECKTFGAEFIKELKSIEKKGGQLFTYYQQDTDADILLLYASHLDSKGQLEFRNEIIKIEDDYRQTANVKDLYDRWNKIPKNNGVFEDWVNPYHFESKALTPKSLKEIKQEDSNFIFIRFLEILRHNVVSDKPNAFNKIFTLFLCKVYDEKTSRPTDELKFQWLEGKDDEVSFQLRLNDLYKKGMKDFLDREVSDLTEDELNSRFASLFVGHDGLKEKLKEEIIKLRLEKNNEFAIKEVFDHQSFLENSKIVKEVVELLQGFRIRYNKRQQYLSDFFELLLTTGLKQESGQFFTPVPIAQFIIKSLPLYDITDKKLNAGVKNDLLPYIIDYAAGSGHFLTESMHEIQRFIDAKKASSYIPDTGKKITSWQDDHFDWATQYVYGIEKDYRLVKVGKVGCYLHGDGLANVILSDGLAKFPSYKNLLKKTDAQFPQENKQFDVVISNPPYSVSSFKIASREYYTEDDFELYNYLTDVSSEIECLFIERTKQLLKDGGIAGIILPSSILNNTGVYARTREIILQNFEIVGIAELGSNTFMATGTNTVTLFLRRRSNYDSINLKIAVDKFFTDKQDVTLNGVEKPFSKYVQHVWDSCSFADYKTLVSKSPNENIKNNELYKDYKKKLKAKDEAELCNAIIEREKEKILYFILAYPQKTIVIKSGKKADEKRFLGYEFSFRRGSEGIHPIQRSKTIDECTKLYDANVFDHPEKASTYIYKAFKGEYPAIPAALTKHISVHQLVDMLPFATIEFEKSISTTLKKKVNFKAVWNTNEIVPLSEIADIQKGTSITKENTIQGPYPVVAGGQSPAYYHNTYNREGNIITVSASGAYAGFVNYYEDKIFASDCNTIKSKDENELSTFLIYHFLKFIQQEVYLLQRGQAQPHVYADDLSNLKIPKLSKDIQKKIIADLSKVGKGEILLQKNLNDLQKEISVLIENSKGVPTKLIEITSKIGSGATPKGGEGVYKETGISFIRSQNVYDGFFKEEGLAFIDEGQAQKLDNVAVEQNDILFNITGASIARCCIVEDKFLPARVNQHVSIIRANEKVLPKYLQLVITSSEYKNQLLEIGEGATSRQAITKAQLEEFKIPIPSPTEQKKIVTEVVKIEKKIEALQKKQAEIASKKEAILKKYL
ncbi:MAG: restriction endonuclease subunit S [Verrucomicrobia bacterium]|nr:restriction endonuclease subunit S [Verrucomicrobiota bacterium]